MAAEIHGILGQASPAANTDTPLYTCPANRKATISTIVIANTGGATTTYRLNARKAGAVVAAGNQIVPDLNISPASADGLTWGIALGATDILNVRAGAAGVTFTAFGVEEDVL